MSVVHARKYTTYLPMNDDTGNGSALQLDDNFTGIENATNETTEDTDLSIKSSSVEVEESKTTAEKKRKRQPSKQTHIHS